MSDKFYLRILELLKDGPATTNEIAAELEKPISNISACMNSLKNSGVIISKCKLKSSPKGGRKPFLWSLP